MTRKPSPLVPVMLMVMAGIAFGSGIPGMAFLGGVTMYLAIRLWRLYWLLVAAWKVAQNQENRR